MEEARPCPWISCRHHLLLEVTETGGVRLNLQTMGKRTTIAPTASWEEWAVFGEQVVEALAYATETCSLDRAQHVRDRGEQLSAHELGGLLGESHQRAWVETRAAVVALVQALVEAGLEPDDARQVLVSLLGSDDGGDA